MKKWIWTRKQKQKLLNELKSDIYTTLKQVESWIDGCESREQLQSVINFIEQKISQYDYILSSYNIVLWYEKSIYDEIKEYLFSHVKQIEEIHNGILEEINCYEQELNTKHPVTIMGFEKIFKEED